jgi:predicted nuclease with TOPRIM domain
MPNIQEIYNEIQEKKKGQKEIRKEYKDALTNADEYTETVEKIKELRDKKKQIEEIAQDRLGARWDEYEKNKAKIEELDQMLTDVAMTDLMAGKTLDIKTNMTMLTSRCIR